MMVRYGVAITGMSLMVLREFYGLSVVIGVLALACILVGELLERVYFFRAVKAPGMPGMAGN